MTNRQLKLKNILKMTSLIHKSTKAKGIIYCIVLIAFSFTGCKKFITVEAPVTSTNAANVYATDATAAAVLTGIYSKISSTSLTANSLPSLSLYPALSADELTLFNYANQLSSSYAPYYLNALTSSSNSGAQ